MSEATIMPFEDCRCDCHDGWSPLWWEQWVVHMGPCCDRVDKKRHVKPPPVGCREDAR